MYLGVILFISIACNQVLGMPYGDGIQRYQGISQNASQNVFIVPLDYSNQDNQNKTYYYHPDAQFTPDLIRQFNHEVIIVDLRSAVQHIRRFDQIRHQFDQELCSALVTLLPLISYPRYEQLLSLYEHHFLQQYEQAPALHAATSEINKQWQEIIVCTINSFYTVMNGIVVEKSGHSCDAQSYVQSKIADFIKQTWYRGRYRELIEYMHSKGIAHVRDLLENESWISQAFGMWQCKSNAVITSAHFKKMQALRNLYLHGNGQLAQQQACYDIPIERDLIVACDKRYAALQPCKRAPPQQIQSTTILLTSHAQTALRYLECNQDHIDTLAHDKAVSNICNTISHAIFATNHQESVAFYFGMLDNTYILYELKQSHNLDAAVTRFKELHDQTSPSYGKRIERIAQATYCRLKDYATHPIQTVATIAAGVVIAPLLPTWAIASVTCIYAGVMVYDLVTTHILASYSQHKTVFENIDDCSKHLTSEPFLQAGEEKIGTFIADLCFGWSTNKAITLSGAILAQTTLGKKVIETTTKVLYTAGKKIKQSARAVGTRCADALNSAQASITKQWPRNHNLRATLVTAEGVEVEIPLLAKSTEESLLRCAQQANKNRTVKELITIPEVASAVTQESANLIQKLFPYLAPIEKEIEKLKIIFDLQHKGFGDFINKYIKIPYKHILSIDFNIGRDGIAKLQGFHHDFMGAIEKSGLVKLADKVVHPSGLYKADVWFNGSMMPKTFFPQSWPQEKVISKIMEAYSNFKAAGATTYQIMQNGKYEVTAFTNDGIKIIIYVTKNGEITSAYPKL